MTLSVLLATRNRRDWLPKAIASMLAQTDPDWELIVLDNGESVRDIVPDDPRIFYRHTTARGPANAYQQALDLATGDLVMPMGDDDTLYPQAVATIKAGIGDAEWGYALTDFVRDGAVQFILGGSWSLERMRTHYYLGGAVFWRRSLSDRVGGFDETWDGVADYDLYLRFAAVATPVYIQAKLYRYNDHPDTDTNRRAENAYRKSAALHARPMA